MVTMADNKGMALVVVLWVTILLCAIVSAGAYIARMEMYQANHFAKEIKLSAAAFAGMEKVKEYLYRDETAAYDCKCDSWAAGLKDYYVGDVKLNISVEDEESKIYLNNASSSTLSELPFFLNTLNREEKIDSLKDWLDADDIKAPEGAENDFYKTIGSAGKCKNSSLDCLDEFCLIRGYSSEEIFLIEKDMTVFSYGIININTASLGVLRAQYGLSKALEILNKRMGIDGIDGTNDDEPFHNASSFNISSHVFKIKVTAVDGKFYKIVEAMFDRDKHSMIYWREL